jgi:phosphatidylethanolamine/phosphatidyl-N-methylethanolamine N-methyltransferase
VKPTASTGSIAALPAADAGAFPLTRTAVLTAYRRMAPVYDWVFGTVLEPGRRRVVRALDAQPGDRVLEVGVGTGLSLPHWPQSARVTGIDLSPNMLRRAERRRARRKLGHVELLEMDGQAMTFPDDHFDRVAAMYVVSVVDNLEALLGEMRRVCKPGGQIAIVNHFANARLRRGELALAGYAGVLGFNPALPVERVLRAKGLSILEVRPANWFDYWTLIIARPVK